VNICIFQRQPASNPDWLPCVHFRHHYCV